MSFCVLVNIVGGCHKARHILRGEGEGGVGGWVGRRGSNGMGDGLFHPQVRDQDRKYAD